MLSGSSCTTPVIMQAAQMHSSLRRLCLYFDDWHFGVLFWLDRGICRVWELLSAGGLCANHVQPLARSSLRWVDEDLQNCWFEYVKLQMLNIQEPCVWPTQLQCWRLSVFKMGMFYLRSEHVGATFTHSWTRMNSVWQVAYLQFCK